MTETFTTTINLTTNVSGMKEHDSIENLGTEEITFYNSIRADLDLLESGPNDNVIQNILNHSQNLR